MGADTAHWEASGHIPSQSVTYDDGTTAPERKGWGVGVPPLAEAMADVGLQEVDT